MLKLKKADFQKPLEEKEVKHVTKSLVIALINRTDVAPKLLSEYNWKAATHFEMVLIITAFYFYCIKSKDQEIKKFGQSVSTSGSIPIKLLVAIITSSGNKIKAAIKDPVFKNIIIKITSKFISADEANEIVEQIATAAAKINCKQMSSEKRLTVTELFSGVTTLSKQKIAETLKIQHTQELEQELGQVEEDFTAEKKEAAKSAFNTTLQKIEKTIIEKCFSPSNSKDVYDAIKLIKDHKVNPNMNDSWNSEQVPILAHAYFAMKNGHFSEYCNLVLELLEAGANPNVLCLRHAGDLSKKDFMLLDALYTLAYHTLEKHDPIFSQREKDIYTNLINLLIKKGAKVNIENEKGQTPLMLAVKLDSTDLVNNLLRKGAKLNAKNNDGNTPLHYAVLRNNIAIVGLLLQHKKIDIDAKNNDGVTPLHIAADGNRREIIELLLTHGADPTIRDNRGRTYQDLLPRQPRRL